MSASVTMSSSTPWEGAGLTRSSVAAAQTVPFLSKVGTDIYLDAAGAPAAVTGALANAKRGAKLGIVAVHKEPVPIDFMDVILNELTIVGAIGYPTEIFEVTKDLIKNWEKYAVIIDQTMPFSKVEQALESTAAAGAGGKVVVTFD